MAHFKTNFAQVMVFNVFLKRKCNLSPIKNTYKVHLVRDNFLHLVVVPAITSSGPNAPIHCTNQLCQNAIHFWQHAYCHYKMHIVIDKVYLGIDKVCTHVCHKKCTLAVDAPWKCGNSRTVYNLVPTLQIVRIKSNCH